MKFRYAILLLSLSALPVGGCATKPATFQVDMLSNLVMMFPGADYKETHLKVTHTIVEKNAGSTQVEVSIDSIQASMKSLSIKLNYNSVDDAGPIAAKKDDQQNRPERYRQSFTGLAGLSYRANVDHASGKVALLELPPRLDAVASGKVSGMFGGDQITMALSRQSLKDYAICGLPKVMRKDGFNQGETVVPGVQHVATQRTDDPEGLTKDPNRPHIVIHAFKLEQDAAAGDKKPAKAKSTGLKLKSFEGKGRLERHAKKKSLILWEEKSIAHVKTSARKAANNKKAKPIYYRIKRTIQRVEL